MCPVLERKRRTEPNARLRYFRADRPRLETILPRTYLERFHEVTDDCCVHTCSMLLYETFRDETVTYTVRNQSSPLFLQRNRNRIKKHANSLETTKWLDTIKWLNGRKWRYLFEGRLIAFGRELACKFFFFFFLSRTFVSGTRETKLFTNVKTVGRKKLRSSRRRLVFFPRPPFAEERSAPRIFMAALRI